MNEQEEPTPSFIRDFLYVDLGRVRSLLSQLEEGLPEKVEQAREKFSKWDAGAKAVFSASKTSQESEKSSETRTFGDLHFSMFEDVAESVNILKDVTEETSTPDAWTRGEVSKIVDKYKIIRFSCPTRIMDMHHFANTLDQVLKSGMIPRGPQKNIFEKVKRSIKLMYPPGVTIRAFPASQSHDDYSFTGTLLDKSEYMDQERATLFARHGVKPGDWTTVGLVSRSGRKFITPEINITPGVLDGKIVNRSKLEEIIENITDYLEGVGFSEAPSALGVAIIPLAIYRTIPIPE
ncbi:hypothetical protein KCV87_14055 [Actinosynnema pretiosum subsp. pretiosum]|uniref:Uncharacterized protein n=1 Tax=Actinosynnema pretiosum subsp. pretiosum TaxID=103721 RepID=A0AA45LB61_9PSEU|nr:hypothetical protein KCV87_14055 [Actinosynnema pretiosum subsp. pretiosum]